MSNCNPKFRVSDLYRSMTGVSCNMWEVIRKLSDKHEVGGKKLGRSRLSNIFKDCTSADSMFHLPEKVEMTQCGEMRTLSSTLDYEKEEDGSQVTERLFAKVLSRRCRLNHAIHELVDVNEARYGSNRVTRLRNAHETFESWNPCQPAIETN